MSGFAASRRLLALVGGALLIAIGVAAFGIYGGLYDVAADAHTRNPFFG